jgi:glutathionyl-hydroquinone reductase
MKKKSETEKLIYIDNVISILVKEDLVHEIKLINRQDDVTKKYKRAQSSVRAFKDLFKDNDLYIEREDSNFTSENIDDITDEIVELIDNNDETSIVRNAEVEDNKVVTKVEASSQNELISKALEYGIDSFDKSFIDSLNLDVILIGLKDNSSVYYSNSIGKFLIVA